MIRLFKSVMTAGVTVWLIRVVFSVTLIWLAAALANLIFRSYSAALRHRVWALSVTASLAVPILISWLPEIRLGWLSPAAITDQPLREIRLESRPQSVRFADLKVDRSWLESSSAFTAKKGSSNSPLLSQSTKMPTAIVPKAGNRGVQDAAAEPSSEGRVAFVGIELATNTTHESSGKALWLMLFLVPMSWGIWRIVRGNGVARRLVAEAHPICDSAGRLVLADVCNRLAWNRNIDLKQTVRTSIPLCVGWRRPCIVLPEDWRSWSEVTLRAVLAHEVTHIVRRDVAWQGMARIACVLYWFHPFAWLAAWRMRIEREAACDDGVLRIVERPTDYARVLVDFASQMSTCPTVPAAVAMAARSGLEERIRAILDDNRQRSPVARAVGRILAVAAIAIVVTAGSLCPLSGEVSGGLPADDDEPSPPDARLLVNENLPAQGGGAKEKGSGLVVQQQKDVKRAEVSGLVVLRSDSQRGVPRAKILGIPVNPQGIYLSAVADADGRFHVACPNYETLILAQNDERTLSGIARIRANDKHIVISIGQTVSAHGKLVDEATGQPLPQCQIDFSLVVDGQKISLAGDGRMMFCGAAKTNASGEFTLTSLAPGWNYEIDSPAAILDGPQMSYIFDGPRNLAKFTSGETGKLELGDVKVSRSNYPKLLTQDDLVQSAMRHAESLEDLLKSKLAHARLADQRVLIVAGSPKSEVGRSILATQEVRFIMFGVSGSQPSRKDNAVGEALTGYAVLGIDLFEPHSAAANEAFLERHKLPLPAEGDAVVAVLDSDGSLVASATGTQFSDGKAFSSPQLGEWLRQHAAPTPDAEQLLADAVAQAKRDNKRVLVWKNAPRCDPCEQLTKFLVKHKVLLERDYVLVKLDARFAHADRALDRVGHRGISGSPWMAILDADGKLVVTSDSPQGNIGFPETPREVSYFAWMLRASAQRLNDEEIATLIAPLTKKKR